MPRHIRRCYYTPLFLQHSYAIEVLYVLKTKALQTPKPADNVYTFSCENAFLLRNTSKRNAIRSLPLLSCPPFHTKYERFKKAWETPTHQMKCSVASIGKGDPFRKNVFRFYLLGMHSQI